MKQYILALAVLLAANTAQAEYTQKDVETFCNVATHNVIVAYKQAVSGVSITDMIKQYPDHQQEVLAGYKLYGAGRSEYEAYVIFTDYCHSLFVGA